MRKIINIFILLLMITVTLVGCSSTPKQFSGKWNFSKISSVEIAKEVSDSVINDLKEQYGVSDENGIITSALAEFEENGTFAACYINFEKKYTYTYDPNMDREATWVFYQTGDNEGFISFYTELDAADGNPDPLSNPEIVYNADTNTMYLTLKYVAYMVTIELSR